MLIKEFNSFEQQFYGQYNIEDLGTKFVNVLVVDNCHFSKKLIKKRFILNSIAFHLHSHWLFLFEESNKVSRWWAFLFRLRPSFNPFFLSRFESKTEKVWFKSLESERLRRCAEKLEISFRTDNFLIFAQPIIGILSINLIGFHFHSIPVTCSLALSLSL